MSGRGVLLLFLVAPLTTFAKPLLLGLGQKGALGKQSRLKVISIEPLGSPEEKETLFRAGIEFTTGKNTDIFFLSQGDSRCVGNQLVSVTKLDAKGVELEARAISSKKNPVEWEKEFPIELCATFVVPDAKRFTLRSMTWTKELEVEITSESGAPLGTPSKIAVVSEDWMEAYLLDLYLLGLKQAASGELVARIQKPALTVKTIEAKETIKLLKLASVVLPDGRTLVYQGNLDMRLPYQPVESPTPSVNVNVNLKKAVPTRAAVVMPTSQRFAVFQEGTKTAKQISIPLDNHSNPPTFTRQKSGGLFLEVRPALPPRVVDEVELRVKESR